MKKKVVLMIMIMLAAGFLMAGCATQQPAPPPAPVVPPKPVFVAPVITLESFEVPQYDGYWYYAKAVTPTKGKPDDRGAPLPMSFLLSIENSNSYPIRLDGFNFTVAFDNEFDLVTVTNQDANWIPAGKTDHVRATTLITARSALLSLLVTSGYKLKEKGWSPWEALERWWIGVPDYAIPVALKEGAFSFTAEGETKVLPFESQFP